MNSINFVKDRIKDGFAKVDFCQPLDELQLRSLRFDNYVNLNTTESFQKGFKDNKCKIILNETINEDTEENFGNLVVNVCYDETANFDYFTMERCICDGTLLFMDELLRKVFFKVIRCKTVNTEKIPTDFKVNPFNYEIFYTVGNFVICEEYGGFGTNEKPWMDTRFTVMLPIKFDVVKRQ